MAHNSWLLQRVTVTAEHTHDTGADAGGSASTVALMSCSQRRVVMGRGMWRLTFRGQVAV